MSCPPMGTDGGPCAHCDKPVWYCNDEEQWFHEDPDHQCFLSRGKAKPTAPKVRSKTWTVHVTRRRSLSRQRAGTMPTTRQNTTPTTKSSHGKTPTREEGAKSRSKM